MCQNTYNCFTAITPGILHDAEKKPWGTLQLGNGGGGSLDDGAKGHADEGKSEFHVGQ